MKYNKITLSKFLSRYAFLQGCDLTKVTHEEVKKLFPNIKRSSFEEIENNPDLIYDGNVVLVSDGKKTIPYYVPKIEEKEIEYMDFNREEIKEEGPDDTVYDYSSMSIYELRCLLERKFNSYRNQCCARNELNKRGIVLRKKYDRNEFKKKED